MLMLQSSLDACCAALLAGVLPLPASGAAGGRENRLLQEISCWPTMSSLVLECSDEVGLPPAVLSRGLPEPAGLPTCELAAPAWAPPEAVLLSLSALLVLRKLLLAVLPLDSPLDSPLPD